MTGAAIEAVDPLPDAARALGALQRAGLDVGDRLVTLLPNDASAVSVGIAAMAAGVVQVPLPSSLTAGEVAAIVDDAEPAAAFVGPGVGDGVRSAISARCRTQDVGAGWLAGVAAREPDAWWPRTRPMAYTSGTTGRRKGVWADVHGHAWGEAVVRDEHDAFEGRHGERHLVVSPLYHSGPFRFAFTTALTGGTVAVLPTFDVERWLETLRTLRPTSMFCVPTHLHRLLAHPGLRADDLASLTLLAHAGAPCPVRLKERLLELAPDGAVWEFYGSTEGQFTVCPPARWREAPGSVGRARAGRRLEVRGEDATALPAGEVGTVWCHAPDHARWEYWRDPERTARAWDGDAFTVGDLGALTEDGTLWLHGRPGDLVITGGVNVYPAEVERCLLEHPAVAEAAVFGVPDDEWGERVVAAVVTWPGADVLGETLRQHTRRRLAAEKVPRQVLLVDDLPRTPTGKVRRTGLAEAVGAVPS